MMSWRATHLDCAHPPPDITQEIDGHTAVFRINYPPTDNYEEYVGSKTTVVRVVTDGAP